MKAREIIQERDEWMHMDSPTISQWRDQIRVQDIKSGPASTFSFTAPASTKSGSQFQLGPDSPFNSAAGQSNTTTNKNTISSKKDRYKNAPDDEYRAAAPSRFGGQTVGPDPAELLKRQSKYSTEINPNYIKGKKDSDWYDPKAPLPHTNPSRPGGEKEKYRT